MIHNLLLLTAGLFTCGLYFAAIANLLAHLGRFSLNWIRSVFFFYPAVGAGFCFMGLAPMVLLENPGIILQVISVLLVVLLVVCFFTPWMGIALAVSHGKIAVALRRALQERALTVDTIAETSDKLRDIHELLGNDGGNGEAQNKVREAIIVVDSLKAN